MIDPIIISRTWSQGSPVTVEPLRGTAFTEEDGAHEFRIAGADQDGQAAVLSGSVMAKFLRADDVTIDIDGSVDAGEAVVTLVDDCYHVPGRFALTIYLSDGERSVAIYSCVGNIHRATSGQELDSGVTIPSLQQLTGAYESAVAAAANANAAADRLPEIATMEEFTSYVIEGGSGNNG